MTNFHRNLGTLNACFGVLTTMLFNAASQNLVCIGIMWKWYLLKCKFLDSSTDQESQNSRRQCLGIVIFNGTVPPPQPFLVIETHCGRSLIAEMSASNTIMFSYEENIVPNIVIFFLYAFKRWGKHLKYSAPEIFTQIAFKTSCSKYMDRDIDVNFSCKIFFVSKIIWVHLF